MSALITVFIANSEGISISIPPAWQAVRVWTGTSLSLLPGFLVHVHCKMEERDPLQCTSVMKLCKAINEIFNACFRLSLLLENGQRNNISIIFKMSPFSQESKYANLPFR